MLDITQIKKAYDSSFHSFERGLLREYLQYQILAIIAEHPLHQKLSFLGGTCLRIVHQLPRFSEDLDFDNKNVTEAEFEVLSQFLQKELEKRGYIVDVRFLSKGAFHCYIKFPELLYNYGISPQPSEKILIQIDTFDQGVVYDPEFFILNKFEFFAQVATTPKSVILSQKLWTVTQRSRLKGRDFFDILFLLQNTKPDMHFLSMKFGSESLAEIIQEILIQLKEADYEFLANDVRPFLVNPVDAERIKLFPQFLRQQLGK